MAFPTNFGSNSVFRAVLWSVALHAVMLWPAPLLVSRPQMDTGRAVLRARLGGEKAAPLPLLDESSVPGTTPRAATPTTPRREERGGMSPGATSAPAVASEVGVDAEGLRAYRMALAIQARPHWRYPNEAQRAGWTGTVQVRVALLPGGPLVVSLERSSGYGSLDEAAMEMLRAAVRSATLPDSLRDQGFALVMPVVFETGATSQ